MPGNPQQLPQILFKHSRNNEDLLHRFRNIRISRNCYSLDLDLYFHTSITACSSNINAISNRNIRQATEWGTAGTLHKSSVPLINMFYAGKADIKHNTFGPLTRPLIKQYETSPICHQIELVTFAKQELWSQCCVPAYVRTSAGFCITTYTQTKSKVRSVRWFCTVIDRGMCTVSHNWTCSIYAAAHGIRALQFRATCDESLQSKIGCGFDQLFLMI